jgi:hypothetical protein
MCIEGLKVSKGMHNFGEKRFGQGLKDDYLSIQTSNTRIVGDFMKSIQVLAIVQAMRQKLVEDNVWKYLFDKLAASTNDKVPAVHALLQNEMLTLSFVPFHRKHLQLRFFELGNNCKYTLIE